MNKDYGCKLSKYDIRDFKIKSKVGTSNLPSSFECNTKKAIIKNQGAVNSCVAHSMSEILEYHNKYRVPLSTNFIYSVKGKLFNDNTPGMYLINACKIAKRFGDMTNKDCPGNVEVPICFAKASELLSDKEKLKKAYYYRIDNYYLCTSNDAIKQALVNFGPVLAAIKWHEDWICEKGILKFNTESEGGYHAIVIYGWNEQGWLIQNSWGTAFGNNGKAILPYEYEIAEARCVVDHNNNLDTDDCQLIQPTNSTNKSFDAFYKTINWIINLFLRRK